MRPIAATALQRAALLSRDSAEKFRKYLRYNILFSSDQVPLSHPVLRCGYSNRRCRWL